MRKIIIALSLFLSACPSAAEAAQRPTWTNLSSKKGDLPAPGDSTQQTGAVVADLDKDGLNDFVLSFRQKPPALVWYRRQADGWKRIPIEKEYLTVEAGGAVGDIDGDGDPDIVFGGDWQSNEVWWWENPCPDFRPDVSWKRRAIKKGGATQHHDQVFGDFLGKGKPQLAFWNQGAKKIYLAEIPADPRSAGEWPRAEIFSGAAGEEGRSAFRYPEGMSAGDIDGDGKTDLLAGNIWFKHLEGMKFRPVRISDAGGLIFAGRFKPGKHPQIVIAPGDGVGPLRWYECAGDPLKSSDWTGRDLLERNVVHGHSLQLADFDADGNLDIFCAEMAKWTERSAEPDNPKAGAWIFYGDGKGGFEKTDLATGHGFHEARAADLDGDGDLDILNKPYTWDAPRVDVWLQKGAPFDILTIHPYRKVLADRDFIDDLQKAREQVRRPDGTLRPVWITEMGWATHVPHHALDQDFAPNSCRAQAELIARTYLCTIASGVDPRTFWYNFRNDGEDPFYFEHNMGIIHRDGRPKPASAAYATMTRLLNSRKFLRTRDDLGNLFACEFTSAGKSAPDLLALWKADGDGTAEIPSDAPRAALVNAIGEERPLAPEGKKFRIRLRKNSPAYVVLGE